MGKAKRAHHSLTERSADLPYVSTPIGHEPSPVNEAVKAAIWPVNDARHMAMLHGIEMNIVDMPFEIGVVADGMLPIATLPDAFFPL